MTEETLNINKPPVTVKHSELERTDESIYRSLCPVCKKGLLLVKRNLTTFQLLAEDMCILCGQRFIYSDIEILKESNTMVVFDCSQCDGEGKTPSKKFIKWSDCPSEYQKEFEENYPIETCSTCGGSGQKDYKNKEDYFNCLADRGDSETMCLSSHQKTFSNPCFITIISMKEEMIPFVLRRLQKEESWLFCILYDIVKKEDRPDTEGMAGKLVKLRKTWLKWGHEKGYLKNVY